LRNQTPSGAELAGLGVLLAVAVLLPLAVGAGLDAALHTSPLLLLVGLAVGVVLGAAAVWSRFRRYL
jgi:F0F1-type ATP synthase assembly protein I